MNVQISDSQNFIINQVHVKYIDQKHQDFWMWLNFAHIITISYKR